MANSAILKTCLQYAEQIKYRLILAVLARISQGGRSIRIEVISL